MANTCKYQKLQRYVSYDNGATWQAMEEYQRGALIEADSPDCGATPILYRWTEMPSGTSYVCVGYDKYTEEKKQQSTDGGTTWMDVIPLETRTGSTVIEYNSEDCGYVPPTPTQYRWYPSGTTCISYDKYQNNIKQQSTDGGETWENVSPAEYSASTVIEYNSEDCGYVPPTGYTSQYLTFVALENGTFGFAYNSVDYSLDSGTTWTTLTTGNTISVSQGDKVLWRQSGVTATGDYGIGTFQSSGRFNVYGNIMSMQDGDNFTASTTIANTEFQFKYLFKESKVVNAENMVLPAMTLKNFCYNCLFSRCSYLTTPPKELPACDLQRDCYSYMFEYCTSLTKSPILVAKNVNAQAAYYYMFSGCTNLNEITCLAENISGTLTTSGWVLGVQTNSGTFYKSPNMSSWRSSIDGIPTNWTTVNYQGTLPCDDGEYSGNTFSLTITASSSNFNNTIVPKLKVTGSNGFSGECTYDNSNSTNRDRIRNIPGTPPYYGLLLNYDSLQSNSYYAESTSTTIQTIEGITYTVTVTHKGYKGGVTITS